MNTKKIQIAFACLRVLAALALILQVTGIASAAVVVAQEPMPVPTIASDKLDYAPGEMVTLTGANWQGDTTVAITVNDDQGQQWYYTENVTVQEDGTIVDTFYLPTQFIAQYFVTARGLQTRRVAATTFTDSKGSYNFDFSAADPGDSPTYPKVTPAQLACPTPSGGTGRAADPLADAIFGNPVNSVESLAPEDMILGQIVPFETEIRVSGSVAPENGRIKIVMDHLAKTTNGDDFGFDPTYGLYCAFIDTSDSGNSTLAAGTKVESFSWVILQPGTANERIQATVIISGLVNPEKVILETWVVLKNTITAGTTGNVQSSIQSGQTCTNAACTTGDNISVGNQTVPLLRVQEFFSTDADLSVTKSDSPDPVVQGNQLTYTINVTNNGPATANGIVVTDILDPNTSYVSSSIPCSGTSTLTCSAGNLTVGASTSFTITVLVSSSAPTSITPGTNAIGGTCTPGSQDLCNQVSVDAINNDPTAGNSTDTEPTNVLPAFVPAPAISINKTTNGSDGPTILVGQPVNWAYVVTNTGNVALSGVSVTDNQNVTVTCPQTTLAVGESMTCTASGTAVAGNYNNIGTASGTNGGTTVTATDASSYFGADPKIDIQKTPDSQTVIYGQTANFTIEVTNIGNVPLTDVAVTDPLVPNCAATIGALAVGESKTYNCSLANVTEGFTNVATATGKYGETTVTDSDDAVVTLNAVPAIDIQKTPDTQTVIYGQTANFTIVVTNIGNVPLTDVAVTDPLAPNCAATIGALAVGGSSTYTCSLANVTSVFTNVATVTGKYGGTTVTDNDDAVVVVDILPDISVIKTANPTSVPETGGNVEFTFVVTNNSSEPFTLNSLTDDKFGDLDGQGDCDVPQTIAALGTYTCKITKSLAGNAGTSHTNIVTASGVDEQGNADSATDDATVTFTDVLPDITVTKTGDPTSVPETGGNVTFTYVVKNNSAEAATITVLSDDKFGTLAGDGDCQVGTVLAGGASCSFEATFAIPAGDFPGTHVNIFTATVTDGDGNNDTATDDETITYTDVLPDITVTKTAENAPASVPETGGSVKFTYVVTNNSAEAATITVLNDDKFGPLTGDGDCQVGTVLAGGASCSFAATFAIPAGDYPGYHTNTFTATVTDDDGNSDSDSESETVTYTDVAGSINVTKTADPTSVPETGGLVNFTVRIDNTSAIDAVTIDNLADSVYGNLDGQGTCDVPVTIAVGGHYECSFSATVSGDYPGTHTNVATASGTDEDGQPVSDSDDATVTIADVAGSITVTKTADPTSSPEPGGAVNFTVRIDNTSAVDAVTITSLSDDIHGNLNNQGTCTVPQTIAVGSFYECSFSATVSGNAGYVEKDVVTATGADEDGVPVTGSDDATVTLTDVPSAIEVIKTASPTSVPETGGWVTFYVTINNLSATDTVTINSLTDTAFAPLLQPTSCSLPRTIIPGGSYSCSFDRFLKSDSLTPHTNVITASGTDDDGSTATDDDDATVTFDDVKPVIRITKTADPTHVPETGGNVTFTFLVENIGNEDVTLTTLTDTKFGDLDGKGTCDVPQSILIGGSYTCTYTVFLASDSLTAHYNVVTATAVDDDGSTATDDDDETVTFDDVKPDISISKTANPASVPETGGNVTFTIVVTNHNSEAVTLDSLTDTDFGNLNGQGTCATGGTIAGNGGTYTCSFTKWIAGDFENGIAHENTAMAKASDNDGNSDEASDDAEVTFTDSTADIAIVKVTVDGATSGDGLNILTGESIKWRYTVTNLGNYPLSNVKVTDSVTGVTPAYVSGDTNGNGKLDLTETWIYEASGTAITGSYSNTGTAYGDFTDGAGNVESDTATDGSSYFGADPQLTIVKVTVDGATSGDGLNILTGETISWKFTVTNVGNVPLSNVEVTDDKLGPICSVGTLNVGESFTCTVESTAITGSYSNTGTASGKFTDSGGHSRTDIESDKSSYFGADPQLTIVKVTVDGTTSGDGLNILTDETIKWRYTVTNVGNVPLSNVNVTDDKLGPICSVGTLNVGESFTCTVESTAVTGDYSNTGTASGSYTDSGGHSRTDTETDSSNYFGADPQLTIVKVTVDGTTSGDGLNILTGETIKWRYTVTNVGNVPLSSVNVTDDKLGPICSVGTLNVGESFTCTVESTAVTGNYSNTGTASGSYTDSAGDSRTDTETDASSYFGADPQIAIVKVTVDGSTSGDGLKILTSESIKWRYTVTNVGNVPLSNVTVTDNKVGVTPAYVSGDTNSNGKLDLTETWIYEASGNAVTGNYTNTGTASGKYTDSAGDSRTDTETDASSYFGANPQIDIVKKTIGSDGTEGDNVFVLINGAVTWKYYVTNTGNVVLNNVTVTDNKGVAVSCPKTTLAVGESMTCTATGTNTTPIGTWYNNIGTATGSYTDSAGHSRTASDTDASGYYSQNPGLVTNSSLCDFGNNFTLVFTPDVKWYTSSTQAYKLSDSNPGQFFYNVFQTGGTGTVNLTLPYPFVTQGATPIHVYSSLTAVVVNGQTCLVPTGEIKNYQTQVTLSSYPANNYAGTTNVTLTGLPTTGFMYINIHLDYGLEKLNGWVKSGSNANYNLTINPTMPKVNIINNTPHTFTSSIAGSTDSIFNVNEFKKVKGFGGLVMIKTGLVDGVPAYQGLLGARVELRNPAGTVIETMTADADGWYLSNYIHNGKAATYSVRVLGGSVTIGGTPYTYATTPWLSVSVGGANKFGEGNFQIIP